LLLIFYIMLNNTLFHLLKPFIFSYQYMWRCAFAWFRVIGCSFVSETDKRDQSMFHTIWWEAFIKIYLVGVSIYF
jgi:hypothetical protein